MKIILLLNLLAFIGSSLGDDVTSTISSLEVSVEASVETNTDSISSSSEEEQLPSSTSDELILPSSTIYPSTAEIDSTSVSEQVSESTTADFDEQSEDVVNDDNEEVEDEEEDESDNSETTDMIDVNVNDPLALVGDNTTSTPTVTSAVPRPPSFTAGSFFIGLLLGLVLLAVAYFCYVYYQRRKSLPAAGYRPLSQPTSLHIGLPKNYSIDDVIDIIQSIRVF